VAGGVNGVYRSTNAGQSWTAGGAPSASSLHAVYSLAGSGSTLYAGVFDSAGGNHGVSKSLNGGLSWASATSGLPKSPVNALLETGGVLLAGTSSGLFVSTDGAASWRPYGRELKGTYVHSLAASDSELLVGTSKRGISRLPLRPRAQRLVPIVLDLYGAAPTHFTTELTLTNRGTTDAAVTMRYTAAIRSGSGNAAETVRAGQQLVIPDAIAYLIGKGVPIPPPSTSGGQGGTLLVTFDGISDEGVASVTARTATATSAPQPVGLAGLAYSGVDPALGSKGLSSFRDSGATLRTGATWRSTTRPKNPSKSGFTRSREAAKEARESSRTYPFLPGGGGSSTRFSRSARPASRTDSSWLSGPRAQAPSEPAASSTTGAPGTGRISCRSSPCRD